eukprot:4028561-Karenia_brevis.AAC.1
MTKNSKGQFQSGGVVGELRVGQDVVLFGLQQFAFNGQSGTSISFLEDMQRWQVKLSESGVVRNLKPENLHPKNLLAEPDAQARPAIIRTPGHAPMPYSECHPK